MKWKNRNHAKVFYWNIFLFFLLQKPVLFIQCVNSLCCILKEGKCFSMQVNYIKIHQYGPFNATFWWLQQSHSERTMLCYYVGQFDKGGLLTLYANIFEILYNHRVVGERINMQINYSKLKKTGYKKAHYFKQSCWIPSEKQIKISGVQNNGQMKRKWLHATLVTHEHLVRCRWCKNTRAGWGHSSSLR